MRSIEELVVIGRRALDGADCRNHCGHKVELEAKVLEAVAFGASPLCQECYVELKARHPSAIRRGP